MSAVAKPAFIQEKRFSATLAAAIATCQGRVSPELTASGTYAQYEEKRFSSMTSIADTYLAIAVIRRFDSIPALQPS